MRFRLTADIEERIVQYVRAGGFDWVAAEACGIPASVLNDWLRRGEQGVKRYRRLFIRVMQARAQARLKVEMDTRAQTPRSWLMNGPGREQPNAPGWTNPARADTARSRVGHDAACIMHLAAGLLKILEPHPEVRELVAGWINQLQ